MPKKQIITLLLLLILPFSTFALGPVKIVDRSIRMAGEKLSCTIDDVDDGDTVDLLCGEKVIPSVRLLGVNTPDIVMPENQKHCYYDEARGVMKGIEKDGLAISVTFYGSDLCADKAKGCRNLVRLVDEATGYDINERLVDSGFAFEWTDFSSVPSQIRARYRIAEQHAHDDGR